MRRSAAAYQKFTEDEIRQANSVDILSLARGYGYEPEKAGRKAVHMKHSGGLYIFPENNRFFQWTGPDDGVKGGAIDFVMREENLSFPEAVGKLIGKEFSPSVKQVVPYEKKEREPLVLPEKADNMKRAYWYLVSVRGISPKIVSHFMNRKMIYQEKKYGNCVFVSLNGSPIWRTTPMRAALSEEQRTKSWRRFLPSGRPPKKIWKMTLNCDSPHFSFHLYLPAPLRGRPATGIRRPRPAVLG